jgi:hypothetical protein
MLHLHKQQKQQVRICQLSSFMPILLAAKAESHISMLSSATLLMTQAGPRVADTRDSIKAACDITAEAVASVMRSKAELHRCKW